METRRVEIGTVLAEEAIQVIRNLGNKSQSHKIAVLAVATAFVNADAAAEIIQAHSGSEQLRSQILTPQ